MSNATKTLTVVFITLLVATVLVKWLSNPSSSEAFREEIVQVDTAAVNRIVIDRPNAKVTLNRNNEGWSVSGNNMQTGYPADGSSVIRAVEQLNNINVRAVATRDPEKYTRFKVDSTGIQVSLYNNEDLLASVIVGAPQIVSRREFNNYIRRVDGEAVYTVEGLLNSTFNRDLNEWRDKQVWDVDQKDISRVDFLFPADSSFSMERAGENSWTSDGDTLESGTVSTLLSRIGSLSASGFVDTLEKEAFGNELYALQMRLNNGSQKTVRLKLPRGDTERYHAVATDFPYVFTVSKSTWDTSVLKSRNELLKD